MRYIYPSRWHYEWDDRKQADDAECAKQKANLKVSGAHGWLAWERVLFGNRRDLSTALKMGVSETTV